MTTDILFGINFGIGGMFLTVLFLGLARGRLLTSKSVEQVLDVQEKRLRDKDEYIAKLEEINAKVDERNDLLASKIDQMLEVSRAHGMLEALPEKLGERVVK